MKKSIKSILAKTTAITLAFSLVGITPSTSSDAASKKPTMTKKVTVKVGKTKKVKVTSKKKVKKTKWTLTKAGKKVVKLSKKKKKSVKVKGLKAGKATLTAKIKVSKKTYKKKCKITVKAASSESDVTAAPSATVLTDTSGGNSGSTATATPSDDTSSTTATPETTDEPTETQAPAEVSSNIMTNFVEGIDGKYCYYTVNEDGSITFDTQAAYDTLSGGSGCGYNNGIAFYLNDDKLDVDVSGKYLSYTISTDLTSSGIILCTWADSDLVDAESIWNKSDHYADELAGSVTNEDGSVTYYWSCDTIFSDPELATSIMITLKSFENQYDDTSAFLAQTATLHDISIIDSLPEMDPEAESTPTPTIDPNARQIEVTGDDLGNNATYTYSAGLGQYAEMCSYTTTVGAIKNATTFTITKTVDNSASTQWKYTINGSSGYSESNDFATVDIIAKGKDVTDDTTVKFVIQTTAAGYTGSASIDSVALDGEAVDLSEESNLTYEYIDTGASKYTELAKMDLSGFDLTNCSAITVEYETEDTTAMYACIHASGGYTDAVQGECSNGTATLAMNDAAKAFETPILGIKTNEDGFSGTISITKITLIGAAYESIEITGDDLGENATYTYSAGLGQYAEMCSYTTTVGAIKNATTFTITKTVDNSASTQWKYTINGSSGYSESNDFATVDIIAKGKDVTDDTTVKFVIQTTAAGYTGSASIDSVALDGEAVDLSEESNLTYEYIDTGASKYTELAKMDLSSYDLSKYVKITIEYETEDTTAMYACIHASGGYTDAVQGECSDGTATLVLDDAAYSFTTPILGIKTNEDGFSGTITIKKITLE